MPVWDKELVSSSDQIELNFMVTAPPIGSAVYFLQYSPVKKASEDSASSYTTETRTGLLYFWFLLYLFYFLYLFSYFLYYLYFISVLNVIYFLGVSGKSIKLESEVYEVQVSGQTGLISYIRNKLTNQELSVQSGVCI